MAKPYRNEPNRVRNINGQEVDPNGIDTKNKRDPKKGGKYGCAILSLLLALVMVGVIGFSAFVAALTEGQAAQTQPVQTDANNFEPFVGLAQAQALAGPDAFLAEIRAIYVRSDGTMDLYAAYSPSTYYEFVRKIPRPEDAPPVGVTGSTNGQWYEPVTIEVYRPGSHGYVSTFSGGNRVTNSYLNEGMLRTSDTPTTSGPGAFLPDPDCTAQQLWETALKKDAPRDAVAYITYDADGYNFNISGVISLEFTIDCKLKD